MVSEALELREGLGAERLALEARNAELIASEDRAALREREAIALRERLEVDQRQLDDEL